MKPTTAQVSAARRIARAAWPSAHDFPEYEAAEQAALTAIIETEQASAERIEKLEEALKDIASRANAHMAKALR